jgi:SAM-dependent methyltransferase
VLDIGCGNGRHLLYLAREFGAHGLGFDISKVAILQAQLESIAERREQKSSRENSLVEQGDPRTFSREAFLSRDSLTFQTGNIADPLPGADGAYDLVLDMMSSHMLPEAQRAGFVAECARVLSPGSWLLLKTFLLDEDEHAARMIREHPARDAYGRVEKNSYLHPRLGYLEHAYTLDEIRELYEPYFHIEKVLKSHAHVVDGRPNKRRFVCVYMTKHK